MMIGNAWIFFDPRRRYLGMDGCRFHNFQQQVNRNCSQSTTRLLVNSQLILAISFAANSPHSTDGAYVWLTTFGGNLKRKARFAARAA
jgi:hypothetical protein